MANGFQPAGLLGLNAEIVSTQSAPAEERQWEQEVVVVVPGQHLWCALLLQHHIPLASPAPGPELGSAPWRLAFSQNKARLRGRNPVFKRILLSVVLKIRPRAPRKTKWDLLSYPIWDLGGKSLQLSCENLTYLCRKSRPLLCRRGYPWAVHCKEVHAQNPDAGLARL